MRREVETSNVVHLPCSPASVGIARRVLAADLRAAGVADSVVSDAALVISELLSNAILHAYPLPGELLEAMWVVGNASVEVAVSDGGSPTMPRAGEPSMVAIGGRGLSIVAHLSRDWGIRADGVGLTVWAVLDVPSHSGGSAQPAGDGQGPAVEPDLPVRPADLSPPPSRVRAG